MHPRPHHHGFTLIELLVVIAIIAILAAILFPVFAKAREKARQAACSSNEKQIMLGILQYAQDNDETLPRWGTGVGVGDWAGTPASQLDPYIKSSQLWMCPSKRRGAPDPQQTGKLDYAFNMIGFIGGASHSNSWQPTSLAMIDDPARTVGVTECGPGGPWLDAFGAFNSYPAPSQGQNYRFQTQTGKHGAYVNLAFADGHVKAMRPSQLIWGNFYGVFQTGKIALGVPCWTDDNSGWTSNCQNGNGDYMGPDAWWGGPSAIWSAPLATPAMDEQQQSS